MPFHIIQVKRNKSLILEAVPAGWISYDDNTNTVLSWWPNSQLTTLIESELSVPDSTFFSIPCVIKRSNIATRKEANDIISVMLSESDTDNNDVDMSGTKKVLMKKGSNTIAALNVQPDFNNDVLKQYLNMDSPTTVDSTPIVQSQSHIDVHQASDMSKVSSKGKKNCKNF